jgi:predicted small secreted protein
VQFKLVRWDKYLKQTLAQLVQLIKHGKTMREKVMKTFIATILSLLVTATQALATGNTWKGEGPSLLATFFVVFGMLSILLQLLPGLILFGGMIKGLFSSVENKIN